MVDDEQLLLEEWKVRYESYRAYRSQYLTTLSIVATAVAVSFAAAMSKSIMPIGRNLLLLGIFFIYGGLAYGHHVARHAVRDLGVRLDALEYELGMMEFKTTRPLERALSSTHMLSYVLLVIHGFVLVHFVF